MVTFSQDKSKFSNQVNRILSNFCRFCSEVCLEYSCQSTKSNFLLDCTVFRPRLLFFSVNHWLLYDEIGGNFEAVELFRKWRIEFGDKLVLFCFQNLVPYHITYFHVNTSQTDDSRSQFNGNSFTPKYSRYNVSVTKTLTWQWHTNLWKAWEVF